MPKKKVNPHRKPISKADFDIEQLKIEATDQMTFLGWLLVLISFADLKKTTAEDLWNVWHTSNHYETKLHDLETVCRKLRGIAERTHTPVVLQEITYPAIRSQGDVERFIRKANKNALFAALAMIMEPFFDKSLYSDDILEFVWKKILSYQESIEHQELSPKELRWVLQEEFKMDLEQTDTHGVRLISLEKESENPM